MSLIGAFLDGVPKLENQGLLLVDLIPSRMGCSFIAFVLGRFHEWASAAWEMQKERLVVRSKKEEETFDVRFIATYHEEDYDMMTAMQETLTGRIMNQWWDKCPEAGDPARPNVSFDVEQPAMKVLTIQDGQVRQLAIIYSKFRVDLEAARPGRAEVPGGPVRHHEDFDGQAPCRQRHC